jgi:hypothetical protein
MLRAVAAENDVAKSMLQHIMATVVTKDGTEI